MDLHSIDSLSHPGTAHDLPPWQPGDAPLAGGTWLFSESQPGTRRLIDLAGLGWDEVTVSPAGLRIGAMATVSALVSAALVSAGLPPRAAWLARSCADALASSFKVQGTATVGGNLCLALPAGSLTSFAAALDGRCCIRTTTGGERWVDAAGFVIGNRRTVLRPGELLRHIDLPAEALGRRIAFRRASLAPLGRSGALLIGTCGIDWALTVTASTSRPVVLRFASVPSAGDLADALHDAIPDALLHDDVHGRPDWRRHMTGLLAQDIRAELT